MSAKHKEKKREKNQPQQPDAREQDAPPEPLEFDGPAEIDIDGETYELPGPVATLLKRVERERDEAVEARLRALADFKNFQRRSAENESRAVTDGTIRVVRALLPVLDHVDLALQQDVDQLSAEQLMGGVKLLQQEFIRSLEAFGLQAIRPQPGDEFDANAHEAMMRQPSNEVPANHVTMVMQPGFRLGDLILRPAKVAVAAEASSDDAGSTVHADNE